MQHATEIEAIVKQTGEWPEEERLLLANRLLGPAKVAAPKTARKFSLDEIVGMAAGEGQPPDDATVRQWMHEHQMKKYG